MSREIDAFVHAVLYVAEHVRQNKSGRAL